MSEIEQLHEFIERLCIENQTTVIGTRYAMQWIESGKIGDVPPFLDAMTRFDWNKTRASLMAALEKHADSARLRDAPVIVNPNNYAALLKRMPPEE